MGSKDGKVKNQLINRLWGSMAFFYFCTWGFVGGWDLKGLGGLE